MNLYIKWILVVVLNSALGLFLGASIAGGSTQHMLGMIAGIATWSLIYIILDVYLQKKELHEASRRLLITAMIRAALQLFFYVDFYAGMGALYIVETFMGLSYMTNLFLFVYFATVFTGLILNLLCAVIYTIIYILNRYMKKS